jgi:hypothetical protein
MQPFNQHSHSNHRYCVNQYPSFNSHSGTNDRATAGGCFGID